MPAINSLFVTVVNVLIAAVIPLAAIAAAGAHRPFG
jgi:hypothetical protein